MPKADLAETARAGLFGYWFDRSHLEGIQVLLGRGSLGTRYNRESQFEVGHHGRELVQYLLVAFRLGRAVRDLVRQGLHTHHGLFQVRALVGTTTIPLASFLPLIADGTLNAFFNFSSNVTDVADPPINNSELPEFAQFSISYEAREPDPPVAVPEPGTLGLLGGA